MALLILGILRSVISCTNHGASKGTAGITDDVAQAGWEAIWMHGWMEGWKDEWIRKVHRYSRTIKRTRTINCVCIFIATFTVWRQLHRQGIGFIFVVLERVELGSVSTVFSQPDICSFCNPLPQPPWARWITEFRTLLISDRNMVYNLPDGSDIAWSNQTC